MKFLCFIPSRLRLEDLEFGHYGLFSRISDLNTHSCGLTGDLGNFEVNEYKIHTWVNGPQGITEALE